jgi:pyrrolidone-carboxylate peptidase
VKSSLSGERGLARARAIVESFRPPRAPRDVVVTGFGAFPGVSRNATADIVRALGAESGIALRARSHRTRDFAVGRGALQLPSGRSVAASLMVVPVAWEAAGALVAKEARATRASLVVMCGVAAARQAIFVEAAATAARTTRRDAFGVRPWRTARAPRSTAATLAVDAARDALERALAIETASSPDLAAVVQGVVIRRARTDAYVCNATAYDVARSLSSRAAHGFVHWPKDIAEGDVPACARVLAAMIDALV